jgi:amidase
MKHLSSGAFMDYAPVTVPDTATGPLAGLSFAVKDVLDVAGYPTGGGSPELLSRSRLAARHAAAVDLLLAAGARFVGKTITDEFAYSLMGNNPYYGTPPNGAALAHLPGGSSSGSASVVAAGLCDFALGTDTAGSIRLPGSFQGLWGIRPTHGRISPLGCMPLAPSFDTIGWFARDGGTLSLIGAMLLGDDPAPLPAAPRILVATDAFAFASEMDQPQGEPVQLAREGFEPIVSTGRILQAHEAWVSHGSFIERHLPTISAGIRSRFAFGRSLSAEDIASAQDARTVFRYAMDAMLGDDRILILPTLHAPAPRLTATEAELETFRGRALRLLYPAALAGLPQVTMPLCRIDGLPVGLSMIGPRGSDIALLAAACRFAKEFQ